MRRQCGASKFEFAVVVVLVSFLATLLLQRLVQIEEETERTEVELTIRNIRVGIQLAIGERIIRGDEARIAEVVEKGPIELLGQHPRGFTGQPSPGGPGQWAWDPLRRQLAYMPRLPDAFSGAPELRWRYVARTDTDGKVTGVSLVPMN